MTGALPDLPAVTPREQARFFDRAFLDAACAWTAVPPEVHTLLDAEAERFRRDARLRERFWFHHDRLLRQPDHPGYYLVIREAEQDLGDPAGVLQALLFFSGMPIMIEGHRRLGIPERVTRDTLSDLMIKFHEYKAAHGVWGMKTLAWLYLHLRGRIFQLGRLQFMGKDFTGRLTAWRHRASGRITALSESGIRYRGDGQMDGTSGIHDREQAWMSALREGADTVTGNPIEPSGRAVNREETLRLDQWDRVLRAGTNVLDIHIPSGSPMDPEACRRSMDEAGDFFAKYFPEKKFAVYTCVSWLMDNQLADLLPATSNVVRFQQEFYLYPVEEAAAAQTFERVFGKVSETSKLPRETRMQRALVEHLEKGGHFHHGGGFRLLGKASQPTGDTVIPQTSRDSRSLSDPASP